MHEPHFNVHEQGETGVRALTGVVSELVFGAEDGLLSTLGLVTGVAAGTMHTQIVVLAGVAGAISGAVSMGAGNYLGAKSRAEVMDRQMREEEQRIREHPDQEFEELVRYYGEHGLTDEEIRVVVPAVMRNRHLLSEEMFAHELGITPQELKNPVWRGVWMFIAYLAASAFPVLPYAFLPRSTAMILSVAVTALSTFAVGAGRTVFTGRNPIRSGLEVLAVAAVCGIAGYFGGRLAAVHEL